MREDAGNSNAIERRSTLPHSPSLPEIVRVDTSNLNSAVSHLVSFLTPGGGGFNYLDATNAVLAAYRGLHDIRSLTASTPEYAAKFGRSFNVDVIKLTAPIAFGRHTRVFQLSRRKLPYGGGRLASYRIPFFFAEGGVINAYFLQPRKNTHFTPRQFGLLASVIERNLLENEFYGQKYGIEIVDASRKQDEEARSLQRYSLADLPKWSNGDIERHFQMVDQALSVVENEKLITKIRRPLRDPNLNLFD